MCASSTGSSCSEARARAGHRAGTTSERVKRLARVGLCLLALSPAAARSAELLRGRCYMGTCGWFSLEEKELVGSSTDGALFKAVFRGWESQHPDGRYDRRAPRQGGGTTVSYVFCSKTRPAVIVSTGDGHWQVDMLALNTPDGPPGVMENTTATYYAVCHAVAASAPDTFERLGRHFGYPAIDAAPDAPTLTRPQDILRP